MNVYILNLFQFQYEKFTSSRIYCEIIYDAYIISYNQKYISYTKLKFFYSIMQ